MQEETQKFANYVRILISNINKKNTLFFLLSIFNHGYKNLYVLQIFAFLFAYKLKGTKRRNFKNSSLINFPDFQKNF